MQAKKNPLLDAEFSDICISTSAAPTFLPAHEFVVKDHNNGQLREYNLIDGGVAANNPVIFIYFSISYYIYGRFEILFFSFHNICCCYKFQECSNGSFTNSTN